MAFLNFFCRIGKFTVELQSIAVESGIYVKQKSSTTTKIMVFCLYKPLF